MASAAVRPWPVFEALRRGGRGAVASDVVAGLTLAAIAIPEQMATARLGAFPPEAGLIAFAAATVGFAAFGASRHLSAGADSTITPIFAASLAAITAAGSPQYAQLAAALAVMVGLMLIAASFLKLSWIADLLSAPVTAGFLAGIAIQVVVSQAPAILGLPEGSGPVWRRLAQMTHHGGQIQWPPLLLGLAVLAIATICDKINPRIPGALMALIAATALAAGLDLEAHGVAVLGRVSGALPHPGVPALTLARLLRLTGLALVLSLVVMVQTGATRRAFEDGEADPDVGRDFQGVGMGGVLAGLFGTFPVNASPPRTAVTRASGGRTQWAGLVAAAAVLALAFFGMGLVARTPAAALAGVLLFIAQRIFRLRTFVEIARRARTEFALAVLTTVLIVALPIATGVAIAMFLSLAHGAYTITRPRLTPFVRAPGTTVWWPETAAGPGETEPGVLVVGFQAPLSFLNAYAFRRELMAAVSAASPALVVLEASGVVEIDFTAAEVLIEAIRGLRGRKVELAVARLESVRAQQALRRFGVADQLGEGGQFQTVEEAVRTLKSGARAQAGDARP